MKQAEIEVGNEYEAKVSNKVVRVKVIGIFERDGKKRFEVRNLSTKRNIVFRSAARLRPLPTPIAFYLDTTSEDVVKSYPKAIKLDDGTYEITRPEAIDLVHRVIGIGTWLVSLTQARLAAGLVLPGIGLLRVRPRG